MAGKRLIGKGAQNKCNVFLKMRFTLFKRQKEGRVAAEAKMTLQKV